MLLLVVGGCATPAPTAPTAPTAMPQAPASPTVPAGRGPSPTAAPAGDLPSCPPATLPNDSPYTTDAFPGDESQGIAAAWVERLHRLAAGDPGTDACDLFAGGSLAQAAALDERLAGVLAGRTRIAGDVRFRIAFEGAYDLRRAPATFPATVVWDLPAGTGIMDVRTGATTTLGRTERHGLLLTFTWEGSRWRAYGANEPPPDDARWTVMPTPLPAAPPCAGLAMDAPGTPFDDGHRAWCDTADDTLVRQPDQLSMLTRYPCDEQRVARIWIGTPLGEPLDPLDPHEYLRDPDGYARTEVWIDRPWRADDTPPADARSSGWTNGNVELWTSPSQLERFVWLKRGDVFERWPRANPRGWGVIDCN